MSVTPHPQPLSSRSNTSPPTPLLKERGVIPATG